MYSQGADAVAVVRAELDGLTPDYVEIVDLGGAEVLAAAVRVDATRLIDNVILKGALT
jgi:pantothenate synthetase